MARTPGSRIHCCRLECSGHESVQRPDPVPDAPPASVLPRAAKQANLHLHLHCIGNVNLEIRDIEIMTTTTIENTMLQMQISFVFPSQLANNCPLNRFAGTPGEGGIAHWKGKTIDKMFPNQFLGIYPKNDQEWCSRNPLVSKIYCPKCKSSLLLLHFRLSSILSLILYYIPAVYVFFFSCLLSYYSYSLLLLSGEFLCVQFIFSYKKHAN